jgi:biotin-(acetyl-CoA carboxylase) ligase
MGELGTAEATARLSAPVELRKLAGLLGESDGLGTGDPRVVVGIGVNAGWAAADFPPGLAGAMTSLHEVSGGRPIDADTLLASFIGYLESRIDALRTGYFDLATWAGRQATTGRLVTLDETGSPVSDQAPVLALGVDATTGALVVEDPSTGVGERLVHAGEVARVRLAAVGV